MLALGVMLLVAIDLIILIIYTGVEGSRGNLSAQRVPNRENPEDVSGVREHVQTIIGKINIIVTLSSDTSPPPPPLNVMI